MSKNRSNGSRSHSRSPQERKEILRKAVETTENLQEPINDNTISELELCMKQVDDINNETTLEEKIHNQEEILLDSKAVNISSKVLRQCTRSLTKHMSAYDPAEFAQKVVQYVKQIPGIISETPDWSLLETQVTKYFKRTPQYSTLLGTLSPLEKKEINRKRSIVKDAQAQIKKPENVVAVEKKEQNVEQTVIVRKFISQYYETHSKPIDFFKLVLHPNDFGKTIENILQISFLVRDGMVKLTLDNSNILVVQPCSKEETIRTKTGNISDIQNVIPLNMEQWKTLKNIYRLEEPMLNFNRKT